VVGKVIETGSNVNEKATRVSTLTVSRFRATAIRAWTWPFGMIDFIYRSDV